MGHLSGPYLAADIYKRLCDQTGTPAFYAISSDDNQSYVLTTANRLGLKSDELIEKARSEISAALDAYAIRVDAFARPGSDKYIADVRSFFSAALEGGWIEIADHEVLFDSERGEYVVEAFVEGNCPHCLSPSAGGICESCGQPNSCRDLLNIKNKNVQIRVEPRLSLNLERYREALIKRLDATICESPAVRKLLKLLFAKELRPFALSYKSATGITIEHPALPDQRLNVWAEMFVGHYHFLEALAGEIDRQDRYVQCFGYDNSFFYVVVHSALSLIAADLGYEWPRPSEFVVNRFFNLEFKKFSTSQNHAIWANDLAREANSDVVRLFLALHGPSHDEGEYFSDKSIHRMEGLVDFLNDLVDQFNGRATSGLKLVEELSGPLSKNADFENPFSMKDYAKQALTALKFVSAGIRNDDRNLLQQVPYILKLWLGPLCPKYEVQLTTALDRYRSTDGLGRLQLPRISFALA